MYPNPTLNLEFQKDDESGWYAVHVAELPGCVSQGATLDEARSNIADALAGYLDVVRETALEQQRDRGVDVAETALLGEVALAVDWNRPEEVEVGPLAARPNPPIAFLAFGPDGSFGQ